MEQNLARVKFAQGAEAARGSTRWCCQRSVVLAVVIGYPVFYTLVLSAQKMNLADVAPPGSSGSAITGR